MTHAFRSGLVAPAGVAVATLVVWAVAGPVWALAVLGAGALAIIAFHLWNIERVTEWARGPLDARPPEGRGPGRRSARRSSAGRACAPPTSKTSS